MRLIDVDALVKALNESGVPYRADVQEVLDAQPTVDAVPVVRCKDCRWWDNSDDSPFGYCMAVKHGYMSENWEIGIYRLYKGDFYCADGERKDDDKSCDTCKYYDKEWDDIVCDGCTEAHSNWERKDDPSTGE